MSPTQLHLRTRRSLHLFMREKLRFDTFWTAGFACACVRARASVWGGRISALKSSLTSYDQALHEHSYSYLISAP
jgi:hypothetical protein